MGEQVVVTAGVEMLDTASANLGSERWGQKQVTNLPNIGRNFHSCSQRWLQV